jgi:hypothetical protein
VFNVTFLGEFIVPHKIQVYPHNDIFNLAHYHLDIINKKVALRDENGLALDCMSFIVSIAFGIEAFINFIGFKVVYEWKERQPFKSKIENIYSSLGHSFKMEIEPYKSIWLIKEIRDSIAHGKPYEGIIQVRSTDELWLEMSEWWNHYLDSDFVNYTRKQVDVWINELLNLAGIKIEETITSARHVKT